MKFTIFSSLRIYLCVNFQFRSFKVSVSKFQSQSYKFQLRSFRVSATKFQSQSYKFQSQSFSFKVSKMNNDRVPAILTPKCLPSPNTILREDLYLSDSDEEMRYVFIFMRFCFLSNFKIFISL